MDDISSATNRSKFWASSQQLSHQVEVNFFSFYHREIQLRNYCYLVVSLTAYFFYALGFRLENYCFAYSINRFSQTTNLYYQNILRAYDRFSTGQICDLMTEIFRRIQITVSQARRPYSESFVTYGNFSCFTIAQLSTDGLLLVRDDRCQQQRQRPHPSTVLLLAKSGHLLT